MAFLASREGENSGRKLPRGITVRRGSADDESATFDVMRRTMNAEMVWANHAATRHHLRNSPQVSFWVAEEAPRFGSPRIVGYARSVVRDCVWSLTEFFVLPSQHHQGLGSALLAHCLADGAEAGADTHLVLASHHPDADSLYIRRAGCLPRLPMMLLAGPTTSLYLPAAEDAAIQDAVCPTLPSSPTGSSQSELLIAEPLVLTPEIQSTLDALDREIVGYARPTEHTLWAAEMGGPHGASRLFLRRRKGGDQIVGYAYLGAHCSGPLLALDPQNQPRFFCHVTSVARTLQRGGFDLSFLHPADQYCALGGNNAVMLHWLLHSGWQIVFQYLFMSSRPLGQLDRYVCHNPLYFL